MLFAFFYELLLLSAGIFWLPKLISSWLSHGKYKQSLLKRFGFKFPEIDASKGPVIWVHAVSVGEVKAVIPLMRLIHLRDPRVQFVLSSVTETGYNEGIRSIGIPCTHVFFPFDFGWILKPILNKLKPTMILISETDFWYRFLSIAKKTGAKIAIVSAKISETSTNRFKTVPWFASELFASIDLVCTQNNIYAERFASIGIPPEKIIVTGNLKFDKNTSILTTEEYNNLRDKLGIQNNHQVIVIGSTHDGEELLLLQALQAACVTNPQIKIILVPRHPERFDTVAKLLTSQNIPYTRYTDSQIQDTQIILIDQMGILNNLYQIADIAIVGGSFLPDLGGHNILEPAAFGKPVIFGPYMQNQTEMTELMISRNSGVQIQDLLLGILIDTLLKDENERKRMGEAGKKLFTELQGSAERTLLALQKL